MRQKTISLITIGITLVISTMAFAAEASRSTSVSINVQNVFSLEFYTDEKVLYSNAVPFTNVDPSQSMVYPDNRSENDGKSDTGVICKSNLGSVWYLKMHVIPNPPLAANKLRYYASQPWNRNTGSQADGSLAQSAQWLPFSDTPTTIYTAGYLDQSNLPFGTLATFNFALIPSGLDAGKAYSASVIYTFTTAP